jgi:hypothetical protein
VTLALAASGESYKRGYRDAFQHLTNSKQPPSWRGTHLMRSLRPRSDDWAKVGVEKIAAELRQSNMSNM